MVIVAKAYTCPTGRLPVGVFQQLNSRVVIWGLDLGLLGDDTASLVESEGFFFILVRVLHVISEISFV